MHIDVSTCSALSIGDAAGIFSASSKKKKAMPDATAFEAPRRTYGQEQKHKRHFLTFKVWSNNLGLRLYRLGFESMTSIACVIQYGLPGAS
jgi:hypothetical protein